MISDSQQEEATLHALGLLDADEAAAFEKPLDADPGLRALLRDLQESAALLALAVEGAPLEAPPALRQRVLSEVKGRPSGTPGAAASRRAFLPWAIAALCLGCSGVLLGSFVRRGSALDDLRSRLVRQTGFWQSQVELARTSVDALAQVSFCALDPTPEFKTAQPRATVLWDTVQRQGKLRINRLAPPAEGKDYQLWVVEAGRKETVSAGVVHVDADGTADVPFQPVDADGKPVVAVAISLEKAGGSPTNQGPILLLGKL